MERKSFKKRRGIAWIMSLLLTLSIIPTGILGKPTQAFADDVVYVDGLTATEIQVNTSYYYDFTQCSDIANSYTKGLFSFSAGNYHGAAYKDATYGVEFKSGNKLTLPVAGNSTIIVGGDNNNTCKDLAATSTTGTFAPTTLSTVTAGHASLDDCKTKRSNTLVYEYTGTKGSVTLTLDPSYSKADGQTSTKAYIAYVCVIPNGDQSESGGTSGEVKSTRETTYSFTDNSGKTAPSVGSILDGTDVASEGILYVDKGTSSGCSFDSSQLRFRIGVILYLPIKSDTTKITYTYLGAGNNAGRPTYLGSKNSGYTLEYNNIETSYTIDDITDLIIEKEGQKYFPIISGGDIKIKYIKLTEYNPINSVKVSGTVENADAYGVTSINFKNLDNEKADVVTATVSGGKYSATLRRVSGNTNYVASISNSGYKIDDTEGANKFTLTGNDPEATKNFKVVEAPTAVISGTLTGVPDEGIIGGDFSVKLVPENKAYDSINVPLSKVSSGNYSYSNVSIDPSQIYSVVMDNADDYEVTETIQKSQGAYTDVAIVATMKPLLSVTGSFVTSDKKTATVKKITFTNMDTPAYSYTGNISGNTYSISLRAGEYETSVESDGYTAYDHVSIKDGAVTNDVYLQGAKDTSATTYKAEVKVGKGQEFETISDAVDYISRMNRSDSDRVVINLTDSLYREQVVINTPNITIKGNGATVTWYYGVGFSYYSAKLSGKDMYYDEAYAVDKYYKGTVSQNPGHWGATVNLLSGAAGFKAEGLTFENSLNRYLTEEELADGAGANVQAAITSRTKSGIDVRAKASKERSCVIYIQADDTEYKECKFLSSQDTIYTGDASENSYFKDCLIEGTTDYICGDGNPVFDECTLSMYSYSDKEAVGSFIVASKEKGAHGYLFNNCKIKTTTDEGLQPTSGNYLARAWGAGTVVFYNTEVESADMICDVAYSKMNVEVTAAHYYEYNTHTPDGILVDTSKRAAGVTIMDDTAASAVKVEDYFDGWTPEYYNTVPVVQTYKVTVEAGENGKAEADVTEAKEGKTVTIKATPDNGYKFKQWSIVSGAVKLSDSTVAETSFVMPAGDVEIKAEFEKTETEEPGEDDNKVSIKPENPADVDSAKDVVMSGVTTSSDVEFKVKNGNSETVVSSGTVEIKAEPIANSDDKTVLVNEVNSIMSHVSNVAVRGKWYIDINAKSGGNVVEISKGTLTISLSIPTDITYNPLVDVVTVLHKKADGIKSETVTKGGGRTISFTVDSLSPFAIVVSTPTYFGPGGGTTGNGDNSLVADASNGSTANSGTASSTAKPETGKSVKTGDSAPVVPLVLISAACLGVLVICSKKRAR